MINIEDYKYLGLVRKKSIEEGTKIVQCVGDVFGSDNLGRKDEEEFKMICQFDPERNEMFFARKIIFVEGDTEKISLPLLLDKLGVDVIERSISIIECGGKKGIELFINVLNKFNERQKLLDYVVMYDKDIPWKNENDPQKSEKEKQAKRENNEIEELCNNSKTPFYVFEPDFERELKLKISDKNKPYKAKKAIQEIDVNEIPQKLKNFLTDNL